MTRPAPRPYQATDRDWLLSADQGRGFIGHEAGLGKSRILTEAATGSTLVVAPAMVLDGHNWDDELGKWADDPGRFQQGAYTSLNDREKTGNGSATRPVRRLRGQFDRDYGTLILDEAHYIKGRNTSWTWAVEKIAARTDRVYLATGTPMPNWADELFVPLRLLYPDEAEPGKRFGSYWRWAERWFDTTPTRFSQGMPVVGELLGCIAQYGKPKKGKPHPCLDRPATDPCEHYREFHEENLGTRFRQRLRDDVLTDLPPLTQVRVDCPMTKEQAKHYRALKREFVTTLEDGTEAVAWSAASLNVMLDRVTTGLDACGMGKGSSKLDRLAWDLASRSQPTLVVAHYQETVDACVKVADKLGLRAGYIHGGVSKAGRGAVVRAFQSGGLDVLVGSLETVSEGLTLTQADMCIFVEKSYKPSRNEQAMRRVHRIGQDRPVTVLDYVATMPDGRGQTVDGKKRDLLATKTDRQMRHLSAAQFAALL